MADKGDEERARASYADRLQRAFEHARWLQPNGKPDRARLAKAVGVSQAAIGQFLRASEPRVASAFTNARIARALGVNAHWLSTGEEGVEEAPRVPSLVAPVSAVDMGVFVGQLVHLFTQLDEDRRDELLQVANNLANAGSAEKSAQNPFGGARPGEDRRESPPGRGLLIKEMRRAKDHLIRWVPAEVKSEDSK